MKATTIVAGCASLAVLTFVSCDRPQEVSPQFKILDQAVFASGFLEQEDEYVIAATADGIIRELSISEGDHVRPDQILVGIKSDVPLSQLNEANVVYDNARRNAAANGAQLSQLQLQINLAKQQLEQDEKNYRRFAELRRKNAASQSELEKAELQYMASKSNLQVLEKNFEQVQDALRLDAERSLQQLKVRQAIVDEYVITADKEGTVLQVLKKKGELVRKGEVIARIGSGKSVLKLFIAEEDITKIAVGQEVVVQMNNYPDTTFAAAISNIHPAFDQQQQSYTAEAVFTHPPSLLLSGTQLQANIKGPKAERVLVVPAAAVVRGKFVRLKSGGEKEIRTGRKLGKWIEIKKGLTQHDRILLPEETETDGVAMPGME